MLKQGDHQFNTSIHTACFTTFLDLYPSMLKRKRKYGPKDFTLYDYVVWSLLVHFVLHNNLTRTPQLKLPPDSPFDISRV